MVCGKIESETLTNTVPPVVDLSIVSLLPYIAVQKSQRADQVDYSSAIFYGTLSPKVYMNMPDLMNEGCMGKIWKLKSTM